MTDQELIQTSKQAMDDLWNSNNGNLLDYEQTAYNCLRLLCIRLEEETMRIKEDGLCPRTKLHCNDECCPVGAVCNFSDDISDYK